ncbi:unnamed protein product [Amoebophrya sp. A25]|nr:unnamed protein product [Amoebophrya sp. A25]|eukprot:GSA25T00016526001.1
MATNDMMQFAEGPSESTDEYSNGSASDMGDEVTWIEWFCHLKGNEFFVEIEDDYVQDDFNLTYLNKDLQDYYDVDVYREALNMILDYDDQDSQIQTESERSMVEQGAQCLYGLIHARWILTARGMSAMFDKYNSYVYGSCPLLDCHAQNQAVLPIGVTDVVGQNGAKVYCPRCKEVFHPKSAKLEIIDGAFFGTSFAHLFFLTYPHLKPTSEPRNYIPRIFGFKVAAHVRTGLRVAAGKQAPSRKDGATAPEEESESKNKAAGKNKMQLDSSS